LILLFAYSAFATLASMSYVIKKCIQHGYVVYDMHKINKPKIPVLGGIAVWIGVLVSLSLSQLLFLDKMSLGNLFIFYLFLFKTNTMAIKVKEINDDAVLSIKVNKSYYLMVKGLSYYLFTQIKQENKEEYLKEIMEGKYEDMDDLQRSFYTVTLLLAEIEKAAKDANLYTEKEILQPGDEGYVAPKQD
jgi:UDP-N-acetylmuramyl pentapeptide phosphotransferase/UDP-N-acetylglucosamine-1-phosphate transferase